MIKIKCKIQRVLIVIYLCGDLWEILKIDLSEKFLCATEYIQFWPLLRIGYICIWNLGEISSTEIHFNFILNMGMENILGSGWLSKRKIFSPTLGSFRYGWYVDNVRWQCFSNLFPNMFQNISQYIFNILANMLTIIGACKWLSNMFSKYFPQYFQNVSQYVDNHLR